MDDNLNGIFDHLDPSDFHRTTSTIHERALDFDGDPFARFLDANLTAVRYAFAAADGQANSVATLSNGVIERMFVPTDDECMGDYIDRLNDEALLMNAHWVFISVRTHVGTTLAPAREAMSLEITDAQNVAQAQSLGVMRDAVLWYAADTTNTDRARRVGYLLIDGDHLGSNVDTEADQPVALFDRIFNI